MLITGFPAQAFGTNCYVVAAGPGEQCVVVDPGIGVLDQLDQVLAEHRLHPAAVLLTHGHVDHTFSVAPVCGARGITAYVHPGDRELLADPAKGLSADLAAMFGGRLPYSEPDDVAELTDGATLVLAGLEITVDHAPGHTGGSVLLRLPGAGSAWEAEQVCLSGDVLFAGSIGRTDLPGGSMPTMLTSLRDKVLPLADDTVVLPGHGPATTIGRERMSNPYLQEVARAAAPHPHEAAGGCTAASARRTGL
ncbi:MULTISPECIES: MBL fold metallo-hydrolase [unclassified Micromonospora]|uniref:MBL fold metallo-hydrolase n=1 Tax=unclassified Micromonospora TaxID=2617518 RepID=UPI003A8AD917